MTEPTQIQNPTREPGSPNRAVIYLRVASAQQADWSAIQAQREACQRWAREHGVEIAGESVDVGRSGRTIDRPGLQCLLADLESGPRVDYVLVERVARLSRSLEVHEQVLSVLARAGTKLLSADESDIGMAQNASVSLLKLVMAAACGRDRLRGRQSPSVSDEEGPMAPPSYVTREA